MSVRNNVVYYVRVSLPCEQYHLFGHELQGQPKEDILLRSLRQGTDQNACDAVLRANVGYSGSVIEEVIGTGAADRDRMERLGSMSSVGACGRRSHRPICHGERCFFLLPTGTQSGKSRACHYDMAAVVEFTSLLRLP